MSKQTTLKILEELKNHHEGTIASEGGERYGNMEIISNTKKDIQEIENAIEWVEKQ